MKSFLKQLLIIQLPVLIGAGIIVGIFLYERHGQNPEPETIVIEEEEKQEQDNFIDSNIAFGRIFCLTRTPNSLRHMVIYTGRRRDLRLRTFS